jgi:hypothetical protein
MATTLLVSDMYVPTDMKTEEVISGTNIMEHDEHFVDGVRVTRQVYIFCTKLRKQHAFKQCLFGVSSEWEADRVNESVWVYSPDEIFARGSVGYGDIGVTEIVRKFYVETEQIRNHKVRSHRRQYNMTSSDSVERMIVASKKHLRPYALTKIVDLTAFKLTQSLSAEKDATSEAESVAMSALEKMLTRSGALTAELANMVKVGYEFKDETVKDAMVAYMDTIDGDIKVSSRNVSIALVLVHPPHGDGAEHKITVQRGQHHLNLRKRVYESDVERAFKDAPIERYTPDTLPEDVAHKIAGLNVMTVGSYVDGTGLRQSDNIYYIAEDA